jgi:hypothetical protein
MRARILRVPRLGAFTSATTLSSISDDTCPHLRITASQTGSSGSPGARLARRRGASPQVADTIAAMRYVFRVVPRPDAMVDGSRTAVCAIGHRTDTLLVMHGRTQMAGAILG